MIPFHSLRNPINNIIYEANLFEFMLGNPLAEKGLHILLEYSLFFIEIITDTETGINIYSPSTNTSTINVYRKEAFLS